MRADEPTLPHGLRVVEFGCGPAAAYCGWLFAQAGHEVVLVEPPGGHALRAVRPLFLTLASAKQSVVVEPATESGREGLRNIVGAADVLITDESELVTAAGFGAGELLPVAPGVVHASLSPFGESGPYAGFAATSATLYALGGHTYITGERDREPLSGPQYFPEFLAGATAFAAIQAALLERRHSGAGQRLEISALECLLAGHQFTLARHSYHGQTLERTGNRYASLVGVNFYSCKDGVVALSASSPSQLQQLLLLTDCDEMIGDPRFSALATADEDALLFDAAVAPWFAVRERDEVVEQCQAFRVPCAPVLEVDEVLAHPQLRARGFWRAAVDGQGNELQLPRLPFRVRGARDEAIAAPVLGAHQHLLASLPPRGERVARARHLPAGSPPPLAGITVLDLTRVWSGPVTTRMLADLGAQVIKIEHPGGRGPLGADAGASQVWNRNGLFNELNRNKLSVGLDLAAPGGRELFLALAKKCDLVIENFSPRVMGNLGIDFSTLAALNPELIMVSMPGYGLSGPMRDGVAYGTTIDAEAGTASIMGYEGEGPMRMGVAFPDYVAGIHAAGAAMAALLERSHSGGGQHVDLSQFESIAAFMGPAVVEWQLTGVRPPRKGNRRSNDAPSGVYRCRGGDWVAVQVQSDAQWVSLCEIIGRDDFAANPDFASAPGRVLAHDEIDTSIGVWCGQRDGAAAMQALQAARIPAGRVLSGPQLFADPHLAARKFFVRLEHRIAGRHQYPGLPFSIGGVNRGAWRDAPCLGEHNVPVLQTIAGYDDAAIARLYQTGAIANRPPA